MTRLFLLMFKTWSDVLTIASLSLTENLTAPKCSADSDPFFPTFIYLFQVKSESQHSLKRMAFFCLAYIWIIIHNIIDSIINTLFGYLYDDSKKKNIPEIKNPILMKSATALAEAIRKREVSIFVHLLLSLVINPSFWSSFNFCFSLHQSQL